MADIKDRVLGAIDAAAERAKGAVEKGFDAGSRLPLHNPLNEEATAKVRQWAGDASGAARAAGARVQGFAGDLDAAKLKELGGEVASLIRKHPIPAVLIGVGLGLLLGRGGRS